MTNQIHRLYNIKKCFLFDNLQIMTKLLRKQKQDQDWQQKKQNKTHTNINSFVYAGFAVYVDVTDAFTVAQDRNALSCLLNVPDQLG